MTERCLVEAGATCELERAGGQMILEVPPQRAPVPKEVLDHATSLDVLIRDSSGRVLNPPPQ